MYDQTHDSKAFRTFNIIDEYPREGLAVCVKRQLIKQDVLDVLTDLFYERGVPVHLHSDNGSEFTAKHV